MGNTGTQDQGITTALTTLFTSNNTQTVAATTTETTIIGSGTGSLTIPANYLTLGKSLRFALRGLYSTPLLNLGSVAIKIKLGSTVIASGTASSLVAQVTNYGFQGDAVITCRGTGVSGSVATMAGVTYGVGDNAAPFVVAINNAGSPSTPVTVDTTSALAFNCTVQWSNNTAGNSVSSLTCTLEALN